MPTFILEQQNINVCGAMTINIRRFLNSTDRTPQNQKNKQSKSIVQTKVVKNDVNVSIGNPKNDSMKRSFAQNLTVAQFIANKKQVIAPLVVAPKVEKNKTIYPAHVKNVARHKNNTPKTSKTKKQIQPAKVVKNSKTATKKIAKLKTIGGPKNVTIVYPATQSTKHNNGQCVHNKNFKLCPACNPDAYLIQRIYNVVENAMKRLNIPRQQNMFTLLGVQEKEDILKHFKQKMHNWNKMFPAKMMTETNINIDHIKPIYEFKRLQENLHFANHISNLQPLLKEDDAFKNCKWSKEDEFFWQEKIAGQNYSNIYYPKQLFQPSVGRITK